jgi:rubrerythrin
MAEFANAFYGNMYPRKLTHSELIRAIRLMIVDEYEAISVYTALAESIDNQLAKEVLIDIANEERVHAGEFLRCRRGRGRDSQDGQGSGSGG